MTAAFTILCGMHEQEAPLSIGRYMDALGLDAQFILLFLLLVVMLATILVVHEHAEEIHAEHFSDEGDD